jgi:antigen flippase
MRMSSSWSVQPSAGVTGCVAETAKAHPAKHSYSQILKSTAYIGGSSALGIAIGIVRAKAMAVLLGPAGVGLAGLYTSIIDVTQNIAGMGINRSGVRQIAEAVGSNDAEKIGQTATVLRATSLFLGVLGAVVLVLCSHRVSTFSFGTDQHVSAVALLSIAVLLRLISDGQGALVQGMQRISDLAKMGVLGSLFGTLIGIPIIYYLREDGVPLSLIGVAAMTSATSWWYSRKIRIHRPPLMFSHLQREASALLKLGFVFMASGLMLVGSAYAIRLIVLQNVGFAAAGLYQSAWALGGLYVGFILQAMGADFYPRLTANANDNVVCNRLVNEQARVGLLLAGPGAIATLTFAPAVIAVFYTANFAPAVGVLRWICLGAALRSITWPMGFIIVAKGKKTIYFWSDLICTVVYIALAFVCVRRFGLNGAGIAFFGLYIFHGALTYPIVHRLSGFRWSVENRRTGLLFFLSISAVFCGFYVLPFVWAVCLGAVGVLVSSVYSIRSLLTVVSLDQFPAPVRRLVVGFGLVPSALR